jgi:hypothetical protein
MSSIIRRGGTFHGASTFNASVTPLGDISVFGLGVFTDEYGWTYAGQYRDGYACGLGVATWRNGYKEHAEHGPDGECDGRWLRRVANDFTFYRLFDRGEEKDFVHVEADGRCKYNNVDCAPDDPRLLALIAQVLPVEVRPAAPARHPQSPATRLQSKRPMRRLVLPPQALADAMATEVQATPHAVPGGRV